MATPQKTHVAKVSKINAKQIELGEVSAKAILVAWHSEIPKFTRVDHNARATVADTFGAQIERVNVRKKVIEHDTLTLARAAREKAKRVFERYTSSWGVDLGILPAAMYDKFISEVNDAIDEMKKARDEFKRVYPTLRNAQKESLGKLFDAKNFPEVDALDDSFYIRITPLPLSLANDFRVQLSSEKAQNDLQKAYENDAREKLARAHAQLYEQVIEVLKHISERLNDSEATLVPFKKAVRLVEEIPKMNILGDASLNDIIAEIDKKILATNVDVYRDNEAARKQAASDADDIIKRMSVYM